MKDSNSKRLFKEAQGYIPGGVNSPVRAFNSVGRNPLFVKNASGSRIYDADNNEYIDMVCSWGALILGHSHPKVVSAIKNAVENGTSYGLSTELEINFAKLICNAIPSIEKIRATNSGTEAVMSAIRLARGFTGKKKIVKFDGCYHGHSDSMLVKAGSGMATIITDSKGIPEEIVKNTISLPYNNTEILEDFIKKNEDIACVIIEPVAGNMGVVLPDKNFLEGLRGITEDKGILLIFDEVITGFRLCYGGAQNYFGIEPDLTCLGKIIGGGFPVGAYGGRDDIMSLVSPEGPVYQAGTLAGNPVALTAGIETLKILKKRKIYNDLSEKSKMLVDGLKGITRDNGVEVFISQIESLFSLFFIKKRVYDYETAKKSDTGMYRRFFNKMLSSGILLPPSQFEAMFLSSAHTNEDITRILDAAYNGFVGLRD